MGSPFRRADLLVPLFVAVVGLASSLVYLAAMRTATGGPLAPPLDDAYIYFQYARAIAEGHPFSYTEGAAATIGATGFLYPFLLAPAFFIGLGGDGIVTYAFALNTLFLMLVAPLAYLLTRRYTGPFLATTAGLLTAMAGPVLWGFLSMMEVGLLALVTMLVAYFFSIERGAFPPWRTLTAAAVLPFCRPEGVLMALFVVGLVLTGHVYTAYFHSRRKAQEGRNGTGESSGRPMDARPWLRPANLVVFLPAMTAGAYLLALWLLIGSFSTSTFVSKAVQYSPQLLWYEKVGAIFTNAAILLQDPFGLSPVYLPVVMLPIFGLGLARQIGQETRNRFPGVGILVLGLLFISVMSNSQSIVALVHHYRYIMPMFPLALVFVAIGLRELGRLHRDGPHLAVGASVILVLLMVVNTGRWVQTYADNARDIHHQQVHMGRWVNENLPEDAVVGINDAGAIAYHGNRRVYDLVGLVSDGASLPYRQQIGATFERLLSLPPEDRPNYFAIYPTWFGFPSGQFMNEIYRATLHETSIAGGNTVVVYELDYSVTEGAAEPELDHTEGGAWELVDSLNSADLEDEERHDYRQIDLVPRGRKEVTALNEHSYLVNHDRRLIDGGRIVLGAEEFDVGARQGEDLKAVMRTNATSPVTLRVHLDGVYIGVWAYPASGNAWAEPSFIVPGRFVGDGRTRLRLELETERTDQDYAPFRYWFYQPSSSPSQD
ncbi:MAG: hypothetical protein WD208_01810 [Dehalococcoidia bacterium]